MLTPTLVHALRDRAAISGDAPALWRRPAGGPYRPWSWRELDRMIRRFGQGLLALGPGAGPLAWLGGHRPEWPVVELGAMGAGMPAAALFESWPAGVLEDVLRRLGAPVVVVEGPAALARLEALRPRLPQLRQVISLDAPAARLPGVLSFEEVLALGDAPPEGDWARRVGALAPDLVASVLVTPGTTEAPKLIRHTHAALVAHARRFAKAAGIGAGDALLARLPPALALERAVWHLAPVSGAQVYVAPPAGSFASHLKEARPTFAHGAPEDWEALRRAVEERLATEPPGRQKVLGWARRAALESHRLDDDYLPVPGATQAKRKLARTLVFGPLRAELGLQSARTLVSGLAPVRCGTLEFFTALDLPLNEAWGLAEAGGPVTLNAPGSRRLGTQGRPLPGIAVRIAADGEVLLQGDTLCLPDAAAEGSPAVLFDRRGALRTGDLGDLDSDGFLRVQGRRDELLVLRGRRRTPALVVEARLRAIPLVSQAVALAEGGRPVALLALDREGSARLAREHGLPDDPALLALHPMLLAGLERELQRVQAEAPETERVARFAVVPGGFSLEEGELTPAGTVRRKVVARRRAALLEPLLEKEGRRRAARVDSRGAGA